MIQRLFLPLAALSCGFGQCLTVDGEWVTAGDVADRIPRYARLDPESRLVRAPFPGARRVVREVSLPPVDNEPRDGETSFCVERRLHTLSREAFADALKRTLSLKDEREIGFELVDYDRSMVPAGHLEFLTQSLPPPILGKTDDPVLWRGKLFYAEAHSVPVWVRVRLWVDGEVCLLTRDVARGEDLRADDCTLGKTRFPPFAPAPLREPSTLERTVAARRMRAGEPLYQALVVHKPEVEAGKPVDLKVVNGGAQLRFQGKSVGSGRRGDSVVVTNPATGKRMEGKVTGQGSVEVRLK